jgi:Tol biopolymer transport system component
MGDPDRSDNTDIYLVPADSGAVRQLTTNPGPDRAVVVSPTAADRLHWRATLENSSADQMQVKVLRWTGASRSP